MHRENAGYTITDSVKVGNCEIVIGECKSALAQYVCWYCKDEDNYFFGEYCGNKNAALRSLCKRVEKEISFLERQAEPQNTKVSNAR